jgi:hypothetical protein
MRDAICMEKVHGMQQIRGRETDVLSAKGPIRRPIGELKQIRSKRFEHKAIVDVSFKTNLEDAFWLAHANAARVLGLRNGQSDSLECCLLSPGSIGCADFEDFIGAPVEGELPFLTSSF